MRILFATYSLAFQNPGGGERVLQALKRSLEELGHEVTLFHTWNQDPSQFEVVHYFSTIERSHWQAFKRAAPRVPLCITPVFHSPQGIRGSLYLTKLKMSDYLFSLLEDERGFVSDLKIPNYFFPTTPAEAASLEALGVSSQKMQVLPNGVADGFLESDGSLFRKHFGINGPFVLHVGRFHPVKNHFALLEVAKITKGNFVFIGSADIDQTDYFDRFVKEAKNIEALDKTGGTKIQIISALSNTDPLLASAFAAASVFVMPSLFETFGMTALEAALAGTPVIFSKTFQSLKWFEVFGTPVEPHDVRGMAHLINQAHRTPRISLAVRKQLQQQFSWPFIAQQLARKYQELLHCFQQ